MNCLALLRQLENNVAKFKVGNKTFAFLDHRIGAYAEYIYIAESDNIALKPENLTFEQSAALSFGGITALYFLQKANVSKGKKC